MPQLPCSPCVVISGAAGGRVSRSPATCALLTQLTHPLAHGPAAPNPQPPAPGPKLGQFVQRPADNGSAHQFYYSTLFSLFSPGKRQAGLPAAQNSRRIPPEWCGRCPPRRPQAAQRPVGSGPFQRLSSSCCCYWARAPLCNQTVGARDPRPARPSSPRGSRLPRLESDRTFWRRCAKCGGRCVFRHARRSACGACRGTRDLADGRLSSLAVGRRGAGAERGECGGCRLLGPTRAPAVTTR